MTALDQRVASLAAASSAAAVCEKLHFAWKRSFWREREWAGPSLQLAHRDEAHPPATDHAELGLDVALNESIEMRRAAAASAREDRDG